VIAAALGVSCATGRKAVVVTPVPPPPAVVPAVPDPAEAVLTESDEALRSGLAAADAGHLDHARADFDRAVDVLLSYPGGAAAEPRLAEAYRRTLETIQVREIEILAAGDGFTEVASEQASIDVVGTLPVGDAPASDATRAQAVAAVAAERPDLPIELNEPVLSCIDLYQGRLHDWFGGALSRGQQYLPHIREVFAQEGIPQDLAYVALVESAFKPTAYSRAKARGVWQFISATGRRYGLQQDWWVDERSDPEKATHAAAQYLKALYAMFGDWNLALAGYNAGEMKVVRAMKRYKTSDFWELRQTRGLRRETKNYVPLIHAAIVIAKSPEQYGFTVAADEAPAFEGVPIEGAYDLRVVAECAGEPVETIRSLNPQLRRFATPADRTFELRVPTGRAASVTECLARLPEEKRVSFRTHVVRRGQTLAGIARANGVTTRDISEANGLAHGKRLRPGTELIIPIPARSRVVTARHAAAPADSTDARRVRYKIRPGDTLASIAARYETTVDDLRTWNGLRGSMIAAGTFLTIYTAASSN
jgi:membrane-bound lytic murein transglycosylase D